MDEKDKSKIYNEVAGECLYDNCTIFGKILHFWNWAFYIKNYRKELSLKDLPQCPKTDRSDFLSDQFEYHWNIEVQNAKDKNKPPSLIYPIARVFGFRILFNSIFCFIPQIALVFQALIMGSLVKNARELDTNPELKGQLWLNAFGMVALHFVHVQSTNVYNSKSLHYSLKLRVALSGLMYKKVLKLNKSAFLSTSPGQIINLIANDINKLEMILHFIPYPFVSVLVIILVVFCLWSTFKFCVLIAVAVLCLIVPIQMGMGKGLSSFFAQAAKLTDERIRLMNEFIPAIKIIKMYCWEANFAQMINKARKREIAKIRSGVYLFSVNLGLFYVTGKIVIYSCLITYVLWGNILSAENVFMCFALLNKMSFVATLYIPHFIRQTANGLVSLNRIKTFMCLPEVKESSMNSKESPLFKSKSIVTMKNLFATYDHIEDTKNKNSNGIYNNSFMMDDILNNNGIKNQIKRLNTKDFIDFEQSTKVVNCVNGFCKNMSNCKIDTSDPLSNFKLVLKSIDFECVPGNLITIVGPVGAGKSSILMAILNELNIVEGNINVNGRISFSCQEAWTFAGTVKENILFNCTLYDDKKYKEVVRVCALERDMTLFPQGDQTIVGERGVALSGGQRARINLARALYYDADIYLLDDPLSAVDPHVAKHIFREAIQSYLSDKIVILVTHQLQFVKNSTKILLIKEGEQLSFGDYKSLLSACNKLDFTKFLGVETSEKNQCRTRKESSKFGSSLSINSEVNEAAFNTRPSVGSIQIDNEALEQLKFKKDAEEEKIKKRQIIKEVTTLQFSHKIYYIYSKLALAGWIGPVLIVVFLCAQAIYSYSDYFLSLWTTSEEKRNQEHVGGQNQSSFVDEMTQKQSIIVYSSLMFVLFILSLIRALLFFKACMNASVKLHDRLFKKVVGSPISFFETNPIGVLLNRVSRDTGIIDEILPGRLFDSVDVAIIDISIAIMIVILNFWLLIPLFVLMVLVLSFRNLYLKTAKYIRMLEGVAKSPVIQHISSTLNGLSTIRAFKSQKQFNKNFNIFQNDHSSAYFMYLLGIRWFVYMLDSLQIFFIAGVLVVVIQLSNYLDGSTIGLIVSSTLLFTSEFQWMIKNFSEVETQLTSVERLNQYSTLPQEPALESEPDKKPPSSWPEFGKIEFRNVTMRYFENESPVLKNLNFKINTKEKIGVVGRTGAGKSSLIGALFRMYNYEGDILIDDINIKSIGLHDLRKKLAIIPQEPVLFTGTVRSNLDPMNEIKDDSILWDALRVTQLDKTVRNLNEGLESKISDGGSNMSIGQKQLICLARAVLRGNRILVMDEATANTDPKTDELIQSTIRNAFKNCSIVTVAHRLNTIIDSDRILVLDAGEVKEFDTPNNLLLDKSTIFYSMAHALDKESLT